MSSIYDWSKSAGSNGNSDSSISWPEGQVPGSVNNSARAVMGRLAEFRDDISGAITATGTANGIVVTANSAFTTLANGRIVAFIAASDNTGATTMNVNSTGAKAVRVMTSSGDTALGGGEIQAGGVFLCIYNTALNSSAGGWLLLNPTFGSSTLSLTGSSTGTFGWNAYSLRVSSDDLDVADQNFVNGLSVRHSFGGSAATGGRQGIFGYLNQTSATNSANANRNYVGGAFRVQTEEGDGGTDSSAQGTTKGAYFGVAVEALADADAVALTNLTGGEINTVALAGSSIWYKSLWSLVGGAADDVQGTVHDCMLALSNQTGAVKWEDGILIGNMNGEFPLDTSGNVLRTIGGTVTNGIDLSNTTISGNAWKSPGMQIAGDGSISLTTNQTTVTLKNSNRTFILQAISTGDYFRILANEVGELMKLKSDVSTLADTTLSLWVNNNAGANQAAVTLGAADSGGSGYRLLRVAN